MMFLFLRRDLKATAVVARSDAETSRERAPHRFDGTEPRARRDLGEPAVGRFEETTGMLDARLFHIGRRRDADLRPERPREMTRAHCGTRRERRHREILG